MTLKALPGGDGAPGEPDWPIQYADELDIAAAHEEWGIIIRELSGEGTLSVANGHAIKRLVEFRVQYERANRHVAEHGAVIKAKKTGVPQTNPYWTVMRQANEEIRVLEVELGIPPVRRGKTTKVSRRPSAPRASESYLKPVQK